MNRRNFLQTLGGLIVIGKTAKLTPPAAITVATIKPKEIALAYADSTNGRGANCVVNFGPPYLRVDE